MPVLSIDIEARVAQFQDAIKRVENDTGNMVKRIDTGLAGLRGAFAAVGGAAVFGAMVAGIKNVADELDALNDAAESAGVTVEQLSALRYAADFAGVSTDQLEKGLQTLARRLVEAQEGSKEAAASFEKLKIDPKKFSDPAALLEVVADRLAGIEDPAQRVAVAFDLLGKSGATMIPMLSGGSAGLAEMRAEATRLGLVIDNETAQAAGRFNDNLDRMGKAISALQIYIAGPVINTLADLGDGFLRTQRAGMGFMDTIKSLWSANSLQSTAQKGIEIQEQIWAIQKALNAGADGNYKATLETRLANLKAQLPAITGEVERLKGVVDATFGKASDRQKPTPFKIDPVEPKEDKPKPGRRTSTRQTAQEISEGEKLLAQLNTRLNAARDLNEVQKVGIELADAGGKISQAEALKAITTAQQIDSQKALNEELRARIELDALIANAEASVAEQMAADAEKYKDMADPFREVAREIERIREVSSAGLIGEDVAQKAIDSLTRVKEATREVGQETEKVAGLSREFWMSFQSGAEDAIFEGEKLSDVLRELAIDIARMSFRQTTTSLIGWATGPSTGAGSMDGADQAGMQGLVDSLVGKSEPAGGGVNVSNTIYVQGAGVSRSDVAVAMKNSEAQTLKSITDAQRRGAMA